MLLAGLDEGFPDSVVMNGWLSANTLSDVMETYLDRVVGEGVFDRYGSQFPLHVKALSGPVAPRVCPDDELAFQRYDALGKAKYWYVKRAGEDAAVLLGFRKNCDAATLLESSSKSEVVSLMNSIRPKAGDSFFIRPGEVHGATGDIELIEVSESSALDFRLEDGEDAVEALDFINYQAYKPFIGTLSEFGVKKLDLVDPLKVRSEGDDSFTLYHCLYGAASVICNIEGLGETSFALDEGKTILIPSEVETYILAPVEHTTSVLELYCDCKPIQDKYIDPGAEATLPEDDEDDE